MSDPCDRAGCACPRIEAIDCYYARHEIDPDTRVGYEDEACICACHAEHKRDLRDAADAAGEDS